MTRTKINHRENILKASSQGGLLFREMCSHDLSGVVNIENNAQASPWGRLSFEESLTKRHRCQVIEMSGDFGDAVNRSDPELVAYYVVCDVVDELHILNVVTAPKFQGLGLGHMLMNDIIQYAEQRALRKIFLEVRVGNKVAQGLYSKWQFKQIALRKKYYRPTSAASEREDALVFMRKL